LVRHPFQGCEHGRAGAWPLPALPAAGEVVRGPRMEIPTDMQPCPSCETTSEVTVIPDTAPNVRAWTCGACGTDWALTVVNPRSYLDQLVATVELAGARFALRALLRLADDAPGLTDTELRSRLMVLAGRAVTGSR